MGRGGRGKAGRGLAGRRECTWGWGRARRGGTGGDRGVWEGETKPGGAGRSGAGRSWAGRCGGGAEIGRGMAGQGGPGWGWAWQALWCGLSRRAVALWGGGAGGAEWGGAELWRGRGQGQEMAEQDCAFLCRAAGQCGAVGAD